MACSKAVPAIAGRELDPGKKCCGKILYPVSLPTGEKVAALFPQRFFRSAFDLSKINILRMMSSPTLKNKLL